MTVFKNKKLFCATLILLAVLLAFSCFSVDAGSALNQNKVGAVSGMTASVIGEAKIKVDPDRAVIFASIQNVDKDVDTAKDLTMQTFENITKDLEAMGISRQDVDVSYFRTYPSYDQKDCQTLTGYYAVLNFNFITKDLDKVNDLIDTLFDNGINSIQHINFELTDSTEIYNNLLLTAISNATEKAKLVLGKNDVSLIDFTEENTYNYLSVYRSFSGEGLDVDLSSQIELTARIKAVFE